MCSRAEAQRPCYPTARDCVEDSPELEVALKGIAIDLLCCPTSTRTRREECGIRNLTRTSARLQLRRDAGRSVRTVRRRPEPRQLSGCQLPRNSSQSGMDTPLGEGPHQCGTFVASQRPQVAGTQFLHEFRCVADECVLSSAHLEQSSAVCDVRDWTDESPVFGFRARVPLANSHSDRTE